LLLYCCCAQPWYIPQSGHRIPQHHPMQSVQPLQPSTHQPPESTALPQRSAGADTSPPSMRSDHFMVASIAYRHAPRTPSSGGSMQPRTRTRSVNTRRITNMPAPPKTTHPPTPHSPNQLLPGPHLENRPNGAQCQADGPTTSPIMCTLTQQGQTDQDSKQTLHLFLVHATSGCKDHKDTGFDPLY
jgi:hypothetical protein